MLTYFIEKIENVNYYFEFAQLKDDYYFLVQPFDSKCKAFLLMMHADGEWYITSPDEVSKTVLEHEKILSKRINDQLMEAFQKSIK